MIPIHLIVILMVVAFLAVLGLFIAAIVAWQKLSEMANLDAADQPTAWRIMARGITDGPAPIRAAVLRFRICCALQAGALIAILAFAFGWLWAMLAALCLLSAVSLTKPAESIA